MARRLVLYTIAAGRGSALIRVRPSYVDVVGCSPELANASTEGPLFSQMSPMG
jgi:hypothetical protein